MIPLFFARSYLPSGVLQFSRSHNKAGCPGVSGASCFLLHGLLLGLGTVGEGFTV